MRKMYTFLRLCLLALLLNSGPGWAQPIIFSYTGAPATWVVPQGVTSILVDMQGAKGGENSWGYGGPPFCIDSAGHGARLQATLAVTCGQTLTINVGGMAPAAITGLPTAGGYNGGGAADWAPTAGITVNIAGGGGGGASDIRTGAAALANRVLVAGGGGGGGGNWCWLAAWTGAPGSYNQDKGGDGGGTTGEDGWDGGVPGAFFAGWGGTPSTGGLGAVTAGNGTLGVGGDGDLGTDGGGGGGGYYGGGGGSWAGGGGGSSYADPALASAVTHTRGYNAAGDGIVIITPQCAPLTGVVTGSMTVCAGTTATYTNPTASPCGTWSTSNAAIGTIDPTTGVAAFINPGVFDITYTINTACGTTVSATLVGVTVNGAPAITGRLAICPGDLDTLFNAFPGGTWTSGTPTVAGIDPATGILVGGTAGTTIIAYTIPSVTCVSTAVLTVNPMPLPITGPSVVCSLSTMTLLDPWPGGVWSSNYPAAASVDAVGNVTGVGTYGTAAYIYYTLANGCFVYHYVSVDIPGAPITGPTQVCSGNSIILSDAVGGGAWTTSSMLLATVSSSGLVSSSSAGVVTISYTTNGCPAVTYDVTINPLPAPITGSTAICPGYMTTLSDASPGGGWLSLDPRVVVSPTGDVTSSATPYFPAVIRYILPTSCYTDITVNVTPSPSVIFGADSICQGSTTTLYATPPTGSAAGVWSSTSLAIAPINFATGALTGLSAGTVHISYTLPTGCYAEKTFVVRAPMTDAVNVTVYPPGPVCAGDSVMIIASPVYGGISPSYVWKKFSVTDPSSVSDTFICHPIHGDVINVFMTPDTTVCVAYASVADSAFMNVYPDTMQPLAYINTSGPTTITGLGQVVTFFSTVTWGGTNPTYQWYVNRKAISGATNSSFALPVYEHDTVYCMVGGNPPCPPIVVTAGKSNSIVIEDRLAVQSLTGSDGMLTLFPNPNNGTFMLSGTTSAANEVPFEVSNMLGQTIYSGTARPQNGKINIPIALPNAAPGTYLLRAHTASGVEAFHFVIGQ